MGEKLLKQNRRRTLLGCIGLTTVALVLIGALLLAAFYTDRQAARFPNSRYISQHSNYRLPRFYRWDDSMDSAQ